VVLADGGVRLGRAARLSPLLGLVAAGAGGLAIVLASLPPSMVYSTGFPVALRWIAAIVLIVAEVVGLAWRPSTQF
jgi:hypothetical protein